MAVRWIHNDAQLSVAPDDILEIMGLRRNQWVIFLDFELWQESSEDLETQVLLVS